MRQDSAPPSVRPPSRSGTGSSAVATLFQPRPGKTDQHRHPSRPRLAAWPCVSSDAAGRYPARMITEGLRSSTRRFRFLDIAGGRDRHLAMRRERALDIMRRRQQRLRGLARLAGDACRSAARASGHRADTTAPAAGSPSISMRVTWLRNSSGRSIDRLGGLLPFRQLETRPPQDGRRLPLSAAMLPVRGGPPGDVTRAIRPFSTFDCPISAKRLAAARRRQRPTVRRLPQDARSVAASASAPPSSMPSLSQTTLKPGCSRRRPFQQPSPRPRGWTHGACGSRLIAFSRALAGASGSADSAQPASPLPTMLTALAVAFGALQKRSRSSPGAAASGWRPPSHYRRPAADCGRRPEACFSGLNTGPASAMMISAAIKILQRGQPPGAARGRFFLRAQAQQQADRRKRHFDGRGGVKRSSHQITGNAISAVRIHGCRNPIMLNIMMPLPRLARCGKAEDRPDVWRDSWRRGRTDAYAGPEGPRPPAGRCGACR